MAVAQRISGPYMSLETGDNYADDRVLVREQEQQMKPVTPSNPVVKAEAHEGPMLQLRKRGTSDNAFALKTSCRYEPLTLLRLASALPPIPRHRLRFSDEAPIEVIPWKAFEPRHENMGCYAGSAASSDSDPSGGVPVSTSVMHHSMHRGASSSAYFEVPLQQPKGPPGSIEEQRATGFKKHKPTGEDAVRLEGFARFIKRHTSPPHTRVTAGGRVVPVGPKSPPPTFHMDFIDRLIQAAEETKQDTTQKRRSRTINWLQNSANFRSSSEGNDEDDKDEIATIASADPSVISKMAETSLGIHMSRAGELQVPEGFKLIADMADGSKILTLGKTILRAYLNKNGETAFENLKAAQSRSPELELGDPAPANVMPDPEMPEGMITGNGAPMMLVQGSNGAWVPACPVADETGNISFMETRVAMTPQPRQIGHNSSKPDLHRVYYPGVPQALSPHHSGSTYGVPGHGVMNAAAPLALAPSVSQPADLPVECTGMSRHELQKEYEAASRWHESRRSRLRGIERWLAKEENISLPHDVRNKLIQEKGMLIRDLDGVRKIKEKYERALAAVDGFMQGSSAARPTSFNTSQVPDYGLNGNAAPINEVFDQQQLIASMSGHAQYSNNSSTPQMSHYQSSETCRAASPAPQQPRPRQSMLQLIASRTLKADAPNFVPTGTNRSAGKNRHGSLRNSQSATTLNGKNDRSSKMALVQVPHSDVGSDSHETPQDSSLDHRSISRRGNKSTVSLRRPDGTPIDLAAFQNDRKNHIIHSNRNVNAGTPRAEGASPTKSSQGSKNSSRSDQLVSHASKHVSWTKQPGESQESFEQRCQTQRDLLSLAEESDKKYQVHSSTVRQATLTGGIYTNENQHFRRSPLHDAEGKGWVHTAMNCPPEIVHRPSYQFQAHPGFAGHAARMQPSQVMYSNMQAPVQYRPNSAQTTYLPNMISQMDLNAQNNAAIVRAQADQIGGYYIADARPASPYAQGYQGHQSGQNIPHHHA